MALGISIYPKRGSLEEITRYIELASSCGYTKCFMCMLSIEDIEEDLKKIKETIKILKEHKFHVLVDLSPSVFKQLEVEPNELSFFEELGVDAIRLDDPFDGRTESLLTFDDSGIEINLNISNDVHYLDLIADYQPNYKKITGSHNFYPLIGSGISENHFHQTTKRFKSHNINTAAFINGNSGKIGSEYSESGVCTLEIHRNQDVFSQVNYLNATGLIDDIYFSTMYISEEELNQASSVYNSNKILRLRIKRNENNSSIENSIVNMQHFYRGDVNGNFIRSTMPRVKYSQNNEAHDNKKDFKRGDVIIINDNISHYKNELQIILNDISIDHDGYNYVGSIIESDLSIIKYIKPWSKFILEDK